MKIAIVILNWNGKKLLEQFLPSVVKHSKEANVYVADNASTDDSITYVNTHFPSVNIIKNSVNGGYAKGYNDALKTLNEDVLCLLNNDVEVTSNWLKPIIELFKNEANTSIIQPKILDYKNKHSFEYAGAAGGFIDKFGYPYCRGRIFNTIEEDLGQYNDVIDIFWASGACFFIRNDVFIQLRGFDESFFAHMEEIDLCWRTKNLGYHIKYVGQSEVYHVGAATLNHANPKKTYLNFRNSLFTLTKNAKGSLFFLILTRLLLDGIAGIKFLFEFKFKHFFEILHAHFSYYNHLKTLLYQRKSFKIKRNYYKKRSVALSYYVYKNRVYNSL